MDDEARRRFGEFAEHRTPALIRVAYLLTGNQHTAEDLVQSALTKTLARWESVRHEDPEGYVRTVMYREQVSRWRQRRYHVALADLPAEPPGPDQHEQTDLRISMREAIMRLSPMQRTILVLRYYEDLTETQVAAVLDCSVGTVRSRTHRAVNKLRQLLPMAEIMPEFTP